MNKNRLTIAAAGSGKTTYLVNHALDRPNDESVLITTYTEANELEIRKKFSKINGFIPSNITVQTWFSFLIKHGVKPFQGSMNDDLFEESVNGLLLSSGKSAIKRSFKKAGRTIQVAFNEDSEFKKHYFSKSNKIYSDKLSKFVIKCDKSTAGSVIERISMIYSHLYVDEVQDLAGYDLDIIKLLLKSSISVFLVGDPRQVTYLTHNEARNSKYKDGKIQLYLEENCKRLIKDGIDETSLNVSHRNSQDICSYSSLLYPTYSATKACQCAECRHKKIKHQGFFLLKSQDVRRYLEKYNPVQLRWDIKTKVDEEFSAMNFGESKGQSFERVLIYPTNDITRWITDNSVQLKNVTKAKFYVAVTRAKYSVAIVYDYSGSFTASGVTNYEMVS